MFQELETGMKRTATALCVMSIMSLAMPALAKDDSGSDTYNDIDIQKQMEKAGESLKDSLTTLMNLVDKMVKGVPQYEAPEILDNGDIIIRRKPPEDKTTETTDTAVRT